MVDNGRAYAWGQNKYGELGIGTTQDQNTVHKVKSLKHITYIAAGRFHNIAVDSMLLSCYLC